jgi:hypothetical protein
MVNFPVSSSVRKGSKKQLMEYNPSRSLVEWLASKSCTALVTSNLRANRNCRAVSGLILPVDCCCVDELSKLINCSIAYDR